MTEEIEDDMQESTAPSELEVLKARAKLMGVKHHPSIGLDNLKIKVQAHLDKKPTEKPSTELNDKEELHTSSQQLKTGVKRDIIETITQRNARLRKESSRLIRIRVTNMNPAKKDWEGEVYTVSNSVVGTFKKYVPFNVDAGWHVPMIIYKHLLEKQCQIFQTVTNHRGQKVKKGKLVRELAIEVLDPLTKAEIKDLATQQAMANNLD